MPNYLKVVPGHGRGLLNVVVAVNKPNHHVFQGDIGGKLGRTGGRIITELEIYFRLTKRMRVRMTSGGIMQKGSARIKSR